MERSDEYLCTGGAYCKDVVELVSKQAPSGSIVPCILVCSTVYRMDALISNVH